MPGNYRFPAILVVGAAVAVARADIWRALWLSLQVAAASTLVALLLDSLAAAAMYRTRFFGKESITLPIILPIVLPGIVTGISLRSAYNLLDIPFVLLDHRGRARDLLRRRGLQQCAGPLPAHLGRPARPPCSAALTEVLMDLGTDGFQTFR